MHCGVQDTEILTLQDGWWSIVKPALQEAAQASLDEMHKIAADLAQPFMKGLSSD